MCTALPMSVSGYHGIDTKHVMNVDQYPATHTMQTTNSRWFKAQVIFQILIQAKPLFKQFKLWQGFAVVYLGIGPKPLKILSTLSILVLATEMESFGPVMCVSMLLILSKAWPDWRVTWALGILAAPPPLGVSSSLMVHCCLYVTRIRSSATKSKLISIESLKSKQVSQMICSSELYITT